MTDGFYRLVDTYGLLSGAQSVKKSDDASAVYCRYADT